MWINLVFSLSQKGVHATDWGHCETGMPVWLESRRYATQKMPRGPENSFKVLFLESTNVSGPTVSTVSPKLFSFPVSTYPYPTNFSIHWVTNYCLVFVGFFSRDFKGCLATQLLIVTWTNSNKLLVVNPGLSSVITDVEFIYLTPEFFAWITHELRSFFWFFFFLILLN